MHIKAVEPSTDRRAKTWLSRTVTLGDFNRLKKEIVETLIFIFLITIYIFLRKYVAGKVYFILPTIILCTIYFRHLWKTESNFLKEGGIRLDNIFQATKLTTIFLLPIGGIIIFTAYKLGRLYVPGSFFYLLLLYPIWGISQQFLFQSFFHSRLIRLNLTPWTILIVAVIYAGVHLPDIKLTAMTFLWGLIASFVFFKHPNIIPLGIAQGILGASVYHFILGKDVFKSFIDSFGY